MIVPKPNEAVTTPNGPGVMVGNLLEHGRHYVVIRHIVEEMTSITLNNTFTHLAAARDPRYPWGLWYYPIEEVSVERDVSALQPSAGQP